MDKAPEAFRTISEVADELEVPKHVLRFWEAKFAQLKPMKRGGGRRYYRPEDVALLRGIRFLLYNDGYTIRGVQKILREHGPRYVMDFRRIAAEDEQEDATAEPHEIPDVAAEAGAGFAGVVGSGWPAFFKISSALSCCALSTSQTAANSTPGTFSKPDMLLRPIPPAPMMPMTTFSFAP